MKTFAICLLYILGAMGDHLDPRFPVDPKELQLNEMSKTIQEISGAVMGIAEFVVEIKNEVKSVRKEVAEQNRQQNNKLNSQGSLSRNEFDQIDSEDYRAKKNALLADRVEKLLSVENNSQVDAAKEEMKKIMEINFIKFLSAMLVTGPMTTPEKSGDILKLMRAVLTGQVDFTPVVHKLPFIMRDSETNQIILMMQTLSESEQRRDFRQGQTTPILSPQVQQLLPQRIPGQALPTRMPTMKPQTGLEKILDAVSKLNVDQVAMFLQFLPSFFEGIGAIVDGVSDLE